MKPRYEEARHVMPELMEAIAAFDKTEANLKNAERLWDEISARIPSGLVVGVDPIYASKAMRLDEIYGSLPAISGWKPDFKIYAFEEIYELRSEMREVGTEEAAQFAEAAVSAPGTALREYRHKFEKSRRQLLRKAVQDQLKAIDAALITLESSADGREVEQKMPDQEWSALRSLFDQLAVVIGSRTASVPRWGDLRRHLAFAFVQDYHDIVRLDWPVVKESLVKPIYEDDEPIPVQFSDLGHLLHSNPAGSLSTKLKWKKLKDEDFERLIFQLFSNEQGYENAQWLTRTNAPDRGRDLSVFRVVNDKLLGTIRTRVIVQCRNWQSQSISIDELSKLESQMELWNQPRVEEVVLATSGRFTTDAVDWIEKRNASDRFPKFYPWPESHIEVLLAERPSLIAAYDLR